MSEREHTPEEILRQLQRLQDLGRDLPQAPKPITPGMEESPGHAEETCPAEKTTSPVPDPKWIGEYEVRNILGRGGMGWVFHGFDHRLQRDVAIKLLYGAAACEATIAARFTFEGETLARLKHDHIVPIYHAGQWEGLWYIVMKHVSGGTLADNAHRLRKNQKVAVTILAKIARAIDYLHRHGIAHRDLKPANILLEGDEPQVADFGLARLHEAESDLTLSGQLLGTRFYMAPEQTRTPNAALAPASDIWSLGVMLFELISGKYPFTGAGFEDLFRNIRLLPTPTLATTTGEPQPELNAIVHRCLMKDPAERYASAGELAEDLERWVVGELVVAAPPPPPVMVRRRWRMIAGPALAACMLMALVAAAVWKPDDNHPNIPVPPSKLFIGPTAAEASYRPFAESSPIIGVDRRDRFTLQGKEMAFVELTDDAYPNGAVIEATVQQVNCQTYYAQAGVYCRGQFETTGGGTILRCVTFTIDTIANPRFEKTRRHGGEAALAVGKWNPANRPVWKAKTAQDKFALSFQAFDEKISSASYTLRVETFADGTVQTSIDGGSPHTYTPLDLDDHYFFAVWHSDPDPQSPPPPRFGHSIGLCSYCGTAVFTNVRVGPR